MSDQVVVLYRKDEGEHFTRTRPLSVKEAESTRNHFQLLGFTANILSCDELNASEEDQVTATGKPLVEGGHVAGNGRGLDLSEALDKTPAPPVPPAAQKKKRKEKVWPVLTFNQFQMLKLISKQPKQLLWVARTKNHTPGFRHGRHSGGKRLYNRAVSLAKFGYVRANQELERHITFERGIKLLPAGEKRLAWEKTQPKRVKPKSWRKK